MAVSELERIKQQNKIEEEKKNLEQSLIEFEEKRRKLEENDVKFKFKGNIKGLINNIGYLLSIIGIIGYITTIILITQGAQDLELELIGKDGIFFSIGFAFGILIRTGFSIQGVSYAKREFETILNEFDNLKVKNKKQKKTQSFEFKMIVSMVSSMGFQLAFFLISGVGLVYLAGFEGMDNPVYIWNSISNAISFIGFGFLALNGAYEKYTRFKIPNIIEKTRILKEELVLKEKEQQ